MRENTLLKVKGLEKLYSTRTGLVGSLRSKKEYIKAVDGVSFQINRGETLGLVGESGCGKTTVGMIVIRLIEPTKGKIYLENRDIFSVKKKEELKRLRREMQMVFQDPYEALSPKRNIYELLCEPLEIHGITIDKEERVLRALESAKLPTSRDFLGKRPAALSGGQKQRVALARAIMLNPKLLVADEPVSMLDASMKGGILNLVLDLKNKLRLTTLFITHDLSVAWHMCDRIAVMYLGKIVESGLTEKLIREPLHPYSAALISAVPTMDPSTRSYARVRQKVKGHISSNIDLPDGCRFHPRCPYASDVCRRSEPSMVEIEKGHQVACHLMNQ